MAAKTLNVNDRVRRCDKTGAFGTIKQIRTEVTASSQDKGKMYYVLWDNGTLSCLGGDALELA